MVDVTRTVLVYEEVDMSFFDYRRQQQNELQWLIDDLSSSSGKIQTSTASQFMIYGNGITHLVYFKSTHHLFTTLLYVTITEHLFKTHQEQSQ